MYLILTLLFNLAAWRFSDWRNVQRYYPTILFMIVVSLFYEFVSCHDYPLWKFEARYTFLPNPALIALVVTFGIFPATMLLFLSRYPESLPKQIRYHALWIAGYLLMEYLAYRVHMISYHNGWHFGWSIFFDVTMFPILALHHKKPLWAWGVTILFTIFYSNVFDIPFKHLH